MFSTEASESPAWGELMLGMLLSCSEWLAGFWGASELRHNSIASMPASWCNDMPSCQPLRDKTRQKLMHAGVLWKAAVFLGENKRLIPAEIQLPAEGTSCMVAVWIAQRPARKPSSSGLASKPLRQAAGIASTPCAAPSSMPRARARAQLSPPAMAFSIVAAAKSWP